MRFIKLRCASTMEFEDKYLIGMRSSLKNKFYQRNNQINTLVSRINIKDARHSVKYFRSQGISAEITKLCMWPYK